MKNILITGAASGIGKALVKKYLENNYLVYAIDINDIENKDNLVSFKCDITSYEDLNKVKDYLLINNIALDMIINVAGIHKMASLVESDTNILEKVIDVNLKGTMLVNNTFHSLLDSNGKIIVVTSEVASFDPLPFNGLYNVSKSALDVYAQALRQELNLLGQKVITIRPGAIKTALSDGSLDDTIKLADETILYEDQADNFLHLVKNFMGKPMEAYKLANYIYKISLKKNPKYIYKKHQNFGLVLLSILPKRLQCFIIKLLLNKKKKH